MHCLSLLDWGRNSKSILVSKSNDFNNVPVTQNICPPLVGSQETIWTTEKDSLMTTNISRLGKLMGLSCKGNLGLAMPLVFGRGGS